MIPCSSGTASKAKTGPVHRSRTFHHPPTHRPLVATRWERWAGKAPWWQRDDDPGTILNKVLYCAVSIIPYPACLAQGMWGTSCRGTGSEDAPGGRRLAGRAERGEDDTGVSTATMGLGVSSVVPLALLRSLAHVGVAVQRRKKDV